MIDLLIAWEKSDGPQSGLRAPAALLQSLGTCCIVEPKVKLHWQPRKISQLSVFAFGSDVVPIPAADRIEVSEEGIAVFNGWILASLGGSPMRSAREVRTHLASGSGVGEYLFLELDQAGDGRLLRNLLGSVQLYVHESADRVLLSTRPSMIASYLGSSELSGDFARWVACYSVPQSAHSIFEGVSCVPPGSTIRIKKGKPTVSVPPPNILLNEAVQLEYRTNRGVYWDNVYANLLHLMRVVEATDIPIEFPLSGGKDSRLILALLVAGGYRDRISRVFTNGPEFSPEVRSAKMVADHFGLPHEYVWSGTSVATPGERISAQIPLHLFVTEGEMSPIDLTARTSPRATFQLSGQESGLRNIAGKRDVASREAVERWFLSTLGGGDMCGILTAEAVEENISDARSYLERLESAGVPYEQIPTKHRVEYRGSRWVSRVWGANNAIGFSPQIFRSEVVTLATYNSGARSRRLEEFHFEMLGRVDPALTTIPFAGQTWDDELLEMVGDTRDFPEPLTWPSDFTMFSQRQMYGALQANFDEFVDFVSDRAGDVLRRVVDIDRLRAFETSTLKPGHVQPLWQVFQCALFEANEGFSDLRHKSWQSLGIPEFSLAA